MPQWGRQPQFTASVDIGHPLARGLVFCMLPVNAAGISNATQLRKPVIAASAAAILKYTPYGRAFTFDRTYTFQVDSGSDTLFDFSGQCTLLCSCNPADLTGGIGAGHYPFGSGNTGASLSQGAIRIKNTVDAYWGGSAVALGATTLSTGVRYLIGWVRTGSSGAWTCNIYLNGALDSSTSSIATNPNAQQSLNVGTFGACPPADFGIGFNGDIDGAWLWNRALSHAEVLQFYRNPYAIFQLPNLLWAPAAAAPADTLFAQALL